MTQPTTAKILLVEDDTINQNVMELFLKRFGYQADTASNGKEALELAKQNKYGLIIMDCQMPHMDGFEATMKIKTTTQNADTNIIALTANVDRRTSELCLEAGMADVVFKPVNMAEIREYIEKYIRE